MIPTMRNIGIIFLVLGLGLKDSPWPSPPSSEAVITVSVYLEPSASPFQPVEPTDKTQSVFFLDAAVDCASLESGDEIGIFDGALCVGVWVVDAFPSSMPATVYLQSTDPIEGVLPGAQPGNPMLFKAWDASSDMVTSLDVTHVLQGDDPPVFQEGQTVTLALSNDETPPVAHCRNIVVELDLGGTATITAEDVDDGSADNCGIASMTVLPNFFTCAEIGANTVVLTVTDTSGNTDACEAIVTVEDPLGVCIEGEGGAPQYHTADQNGDNLISLSELLRVIQFYNSGGLHCQEGTEDGYAPGPPGNTDCMPHASDYNPQDWSISLSELLRVIQFYNSGGYYWCPEEGTEDGYCPGPGPEPE